MLEYDIFHVIVLLVLLSDLLASQTSLRRYVVNYLLSTSWSSVRMHSQLAVHTVPK